MQKNISREKTNKQKILAYLFHYPEMMATSTLEYFRPVFVFSRNIILCFGILLYVFLHVKNCEGSETYPVGMLTG